MDVLHITPRKYGQIAVYGSRNVRTLSLIAGLALRQGT